VSWSRITTPSDRSSPKPLKNAMLKNESMAATRAADARGRIFAITAVILLSRILGLRMDQPAANPRIADRKLRINGWAKRVEDER
jgi:hypothetical protein